MIIVDTGPLVAVVNETDSYHAVCLKWLEGTDPEELVIPAPVIAEVCYHIGRDLGADVESVFLEDLSEGIYGRVLGITPEDLHRMSVLVKQYSGFPLGGTDASVVAVAERLKIEDVATVDRRHFCAVRPSHVVAFNVLPAQL